MLTEIQVICMQLVNPLERRLNGKNKKNKLQFLYYNAVVNIPSINFPTRKEYLNDTKGSIRSKAAQQDKLK